MAFSTVGSRVTWNSSLIANVTSISISGLTTEALDATEITDGTSKYLPGRKNEGTCTVVCRPTDVSTVATLRAYSGTGPHSLVVDDGDATSATEFVDVKGTCTDVAGPDLDGAGLAEMTLTFQLEPA